MLGGAFAAFTVSAGIMHSYAVFLLAFIEEFRWSRGETAAGEEDDKPAHAATLGGAAVG